MIDPRDHRRIAAMATNQSNGRGYFFPAVPAEPSFLQVAVRALFNPGTIIAAVMLGVSVYLMVRF